MVIRLRDIPFVLRHFEGTRRNWRAIRALRIPHPLDPPSTTKEQ